jgi:hypothetical protein
MVAMRTKKFWKKLPSKVRGLLTRQRERYTRSIKSREMLGVMRVVLVTVSSAVYEGVVCLLPTCMREPVERVGSACLACVCAPFALVRQRMRSRSRDSTASLRGSDHDKLIAGGGKPGVVRGPSMGVLVPYGEEDDDGPPQNTPAVILPRQLPACPVSKFRLNLPASHRKTRNAGLLKEHAASGAGPSTSARLTDDGSGDSGSTPGSIGKRRILTMLLPYKDASLPKPPSSDKAGQMKGKIMQEQI